MAYNLAELIDIPNLQRLMELFHTATAIPVGIIDTDGTILVATGWKDICARFHRLHPVTAARCRESDDYIKSHLKSGNYVQYKCRNGLWDVAVPIVIGGEHVATLFLGQFFYDDETVDREFFRRLGMECGFELDRYLAALAEVPVMSRKSVADIMAYYANFVGFLTELGLSRLKQAAAEQSLRRSEERFRTLFENSSDLIAIINPDGTGRFVSPSITQLLGYTPEEVDGWSVFDLVHPDDLPMASATFTALLGEPGGNRRLVCRLKSHDGTWRVCETVARNLIHDPAAEGLLVNVRDITERHRAEKALLESEETFSRIFNTAPIPISIATLEEGRYLEVNKAFERVTGYARDEVVGRLASELVLWHDLSERSRMVAILREKGELHNFEFIARDKGGRLHTGLMSACVIDLHGEKCTINLNYDITELKKAEEALKKSEEKFSRAFSTAPIAMAITRLADGRYLEVNKSFEFMTGHTRREAIGRSSAELGLWHDIAERDRMLAILEETGEVHNHEFIIRNKAGQLRIGVMSACLIDLNGEKCVISLADDVTENKRAEDALRRSETRYHSIFNTAAVSIWEENFSRVKTAIDKIKGDGVEDFRAWLDAHPEFIEEAARTTEVVDVNDVTVSMYEAASREELLGSLDRVLTPESHAAFREIITAIAEGKRYFETESFNKTLKGKPLNVLVRITIPAEESAFRNLLVSVIDITARKRAEAEIEALNTNLAARAAELEAANRGLEAFSYSLSHDLRNPLTRIYVCAQELRDGHADRLDETGRNFVTWICEATEKIEELINAMLELAHLTRKGVHHTEINLAELARKIALGLQVAEPERRIEFVIAPDIIVSGDPQMLKVALENLIGNAWKYTRKVPEALIEFGATTCQGETVYFVRDNGAGFDMADSERMFLPFQRLHREEEFEGNGIGLATVQRIIKRHGGRIWAEGARGQGATFYFTLR